MASKSGAARPSGGGGGDAGRWPPRQMGPWLTLYVPSTYARSRTEAGVRMATRRQLLGVAPWPYQISAWLGLRLLRGLCGWTLHLGTGEEVNCGWWHQEPPPLTHQSQPRSLAGLNVCEEMGPQPPCLWVWAGISEHILGLFVDWGLKKAPPWHSVSLYFCPKIHKMCRRVVVQMWILGLFDDICLINVGKIRGVLPLRFCGKTLEMCTIIFAFEFLTGITFACFMFTASSLYSFFYLPESFMQNVMWGLMDVFGNQYNLHWNYAYRLCQEPFPAIIDVNFAVILPYYREMRNLRKCKLGCLNDGLSPTKNVGLSSVHLPLTMAYPAVFIWLQHFTSIFEEESSGKGPGLALSLTHQNVNSKIWQMLFLW